MDNKNNQPKQVHNDGVHLPEHDFAGLSQVIEKAKPSLPGTERGFVPLEGYDLSKPYDTAERILEAWQKRLEDSPEDAKTIISKLQAAKKELADKHDADFEQRIKDLERNYGERKGELGEHHKVQLDLLSQLRDDWQQRAQAYEQRKTELEERRVDVLTGYYEARINDLTTYHTTIESNLTNQITNLKERERVLQQKVDGLDSLREAHLTERRDWLAERERALDSGSDRYLTARTGSLAELLTAHKEILNTTENRGQTPGQIVARKCCPYKIAKILAFGIGIAIGIGIAVRYLH